MKGSPIAQYPIPNKLAEHVIAARRHAARAVARRRQRPQRLRGRVLPRRDRQGAVEGSDRVPAGAVGRAAAHAAPAARRRGDVGLDAQARRPRPRRRHHGEGRHAGGRRRRGVGRPRQRQDQGAQCLVRASTPASRCSRSNLAAQTEGSIVYGLGHVLREQIIIKDGQRAAVELHRLRDRAHVGRAEYRGAGGLDRQSADRRRRGRPAGARLRGRQCDRDAHRRAAARAAVLARAGARRAWEFRSRPGA